MLPEISARRSLLEPRFRYLSPGSEGEKCRPLDHMWQTPFIHSVQTVITSKFHIYIKVCRFFLPSGTDLYALVLWIINNCACAFQKHWAQGWERLFKWFWFPYWHARYFSKHTYWKKKKIGHNLVPTYKIFVVFSLCSSQKKLKTKHYEQQLQKRKNNIRLAPCRKTGTVYKRWEKSSFSKGYSKAKWSKMINTRTKIPETTLLKPEELFYAANCSKTHLKFEKSLHVKNWQNWPFCKC